MIAPDGTIYGLHGPQGAPLVVLIHGLGLNRAVWDLTLPALARRYRVLAYDICGHGQTPAPRQVPDLALLAAQVAALLDHVGAQKATLVGFSLGGMIARRFAQDYPDRTAALAILHSPHLRTPQAQAAILARVEQARAEGPASTVEAALPRWFTDDFRQSNPAMIDKVRGWVLANDRTTYPLFYAILATGVAEIVAPAPPVTCPTLVMTGDQDFGNGPEMTRAIAAEIAGAETLILPGLRHMALIEDPALTNATLLTFLDRALPQDALPVIEPRRLRDAFGRFATGVTVLTARQEDGTPRGFTANSFTSVSLDPPLLLACLAKTAHSCETFLRAGHFGVNILGQDQQAISALFASRTPDKFSQCRWHDGQAQVPVLDGALAQFVCRQERTVDAGDHIVLIGRVVDFATGEGAPLGYYLGRYFSVEADAQLVQAVAATSGARVGAVLLQDGAVLMEVAADGGLSLPQSPQPAPSMERLRFRLAALGLHAEVEFLYAVFEDRGSASHCIYYRGQVSGTVPPGMRYCALADLDWSAMRNAAERIMLQRYAAETQSGAFGIYEGNETEGKVRRLSGA